MKIIKTFVFCFLWSQFCKAGPVTNGYKVLASSTDTISAHKMCVQVTNSKPNDLFVPLKTSLEFGSFLSGNTSQLTLNNCGIPFANDVVAYWEFNSSKPIISGQSVSATIGPHLIATNGSQGLSYLPGVRGNALNFSQVDILNYALASSFPFPTTALTVAFWVKTNATGNRTLFSYSNPAFANGFLMITPSNIELNIRDNTYFTGINVADNQWHHLAVTYNSSNFIAKVYKDGVLASTNTFPTSATLTTNGTFVLGQEQDSPGGGFDSTQSFQGILDDFIIFNKELSEFDIAALYNQSTGTSCKNILLNNPSSPSGQYIIDVDGNAGPKTPFTVYCDMLTDGGGWTLLAKSTGADRTDALNNNSNTSSWLTGNNSGTTISLSNETFFSGRVYSDLPVSDFMIRSLTTSSKRLTWTHFANAPSTKFYFDQRNQVSGVKTAGGLELLDYRATCDIGTVPASVYYGIFPTDQDSSGGVSRNALNNTYTFNNIWFGSMIGWGSLVSDYNSGKNLAGGFGSVNSGDFRWNFSRHIHGIGNGCNSTEWSASGGQGNQVFNAHGLFVRESQTYSSCKAIKLALPSAPSGVYTVDVDGESGPLSAIQTYCDMVTDGGGWTLVMANTNSTYIHLLSGDLSLVKPTSNGAHNQIDRIASIASSMRWTDLSLNKFFWVNPISSMSNFVNSLRTLPCNTGNPTAVVKLEGGYLGTSIVGRNMEACSLGNGRFYIGFRNNNNYSQFRDILNNNTTHECWHDSNTTSLDRPFALHGDPIGQGYCNQFGYDYTGKGAGRGGTMNYLVWFR